MTIPEFLERLRATPGPWGLNCTGNLRQQMHQGQFGTCPVCAVEGSGRWHTDFRSAAEALGLSPADAGQLAHAADIADGVYQETRAQLLAATVERPR